MHGIDPRLEASPFWAHILNPGESTMYHATVPAPIPAPDFHGCTTHPSARAPGI
jgi:hypothetical protein